MNTSLKGASALTLGLVIATGAGIGSANAATNAELEQRIQRLEQMLQETRAQQQADTNVRSAEPDMDKSSKVDQPDEGFRLSDNTTLKVGGYVKFDTVYSTSSDGPVGEKGRNFYIPSTIPVGSGDSYSYTDFNARQTRINLTSLTDLGDHKIKGFVEFDFYGTDGSDGLSNDFAPRLRHAFVEVDDTWLFGQTWSNFMDLGAFPETLDFFASNEGIVYARQPQVRYTNHDWTPGELSFSLENPYNSLGAGEDVALDGAEDESGLPEATVNYTQSTGFGHLSLGGLVHQISADNLENTNPVIEDDSAVGYGVRLSGTINLGGSGDKIGFSGTYGDGLGRYLGLGVIDEGYVDSSGDIETIPYVGGYAFLRHYWSPKWRSNLVAGILDVDNDEAQGPDVTKKVNSVHANLLWNPLEPITLGIEYAYAEREVESGADGAINRVQASAKYAF
ncbi:porin [Salinisphaera orenii MK-B5]|uniref:Porin n=1 Tax=Salinisphaera orenii MK-B5 TaxID=856730 RepID=A0A423PP84_9GAMM|nr:DcaP family trimeric outer membrane transporter [Salinisphaera orenii]ROO27362.1 porin [Salinisphaera orenii MK-B5]